LAFGKDKILSIEITDNIVDSDSNFFKYMAYGTCHMLKEIWIIVNNIVSNQLILEGLIRAMSQLTERNQLM